MKKNDNFKMKPSSIRTEMSLRYLLAVLGIIALCQNSYAQSWQTIGSAGFSAGFTECNSIAIDKNGKIGRAHV